MNQQDQNHVLEYRVLSGALCRTLVAILACPPMILLATGCASTKTTERKVLVTEQLPRPSHIWVYDFAATAAAVPADSELTDTFTVEAMPQTPEQIALGQRLGAQIATDLVSRFQDMGLPAVHATGDETIDVNDIVIRGYLVSHKKGSAAGRVVVGFGVGASELHIVVEGFHMTPHGLHELTLHAVRAGGGKAPGVGVGAAGLVAGGGPAGLLIGAGIRVYGEASGQSTLQGRVQSTNKQIAAELRQVFQGQGWIAS